MPWYFIVSFVIGLIAHGIIVTPESELSYKMCFLAKSIFAICLQFDILIIAQRVFCGG